MAVELIVGALGALGSLTAALVKTLSKKPETPEEVTLTVQRDHGIVEKHGLMRADEVSRVLDMIHDESQIKPAVR